MAQPEERLAILRFSCGDQLFAVDIRSVQDVVERPYVALFPESRPGLLGIANIRGRIIPVRDAGHGARGDAARLLVLEFEPGRPFGVLVDKVQKLNLDADLRDGARDVALGGEPVRLVRGEPELIKGA